MKAYRTTTVFAAFLAICTCFTIAQAARIRRSDGSPNDPSVVPLRIDGSETDPYWLKAKDVVYRTVPDLLVQHQVELARGITHDKLMHGDLTNRRIALTFDDGPHPNFTPKLLAILKKYDVKATFFVVGEMAEENPKLVKAEIAGGHNVGNHTYHHVTLTKLPPAYVATEMKACGNVLQKIIGKAPHLFRPPGGDYNDHVAEVAEALGYKMILWTDDPGDYASPGADVILHRILKRVTNGGIILIHDGVQQTVDVLPQLLNALKLRGYQFVTVDQMLQQK